MLPAYIRSLPNLPDVVDPADFLRVLRHVLTSTLGQSVQITLRGAHALCASRVDRSELQTALEQLIRNARDLMPNGGVLEVTIWQHFVSPEDPPSSLPAGRYLAIGFADAGLGMTPRMVRRVFEAASDGESTLPVVVTRLRLVRRFAADAGGQLQLQSRLGYGARVEVFLPAA